ncbi:hypothetical protein HYDPIDRAFT_115562 [Hydnomerulius pinastri MD-312]|uniref:Uncharacterized protein n=1 Tax=Hydnomerulius pinastri MD-312 TaxID=994086 RepID=A0A0C9V7X1_9AGAM|nr:hypothetical protein HYDPIDRAFT_115562 [Hydnomerulius pinastri MD-312]
MASTSTMPSASETLSPQQLGPVYFKPLQGPATSDWSRRASWTTISDPGDAGRRVPTNHVPVTVYRIQKNWLFSCKAAVLLSVVFTVLAVGLLVLLKSLRTEYGNRSAWTACLFFSYSAVMFNAAGALSSVTLMHQLGNIQIPTFYSRMLAANAAFGMSREEHANAQDHALRYYGTGRMWIFMTWHWVGCLFGGVLCIIAEVMVFIWLNESAELKAALACVAALVALPLLWLLILRMFHLP